jgi:hypothetical protein
MTTEERIRGLEKNVAELANLLNTLTWGHHANDVQNRSCRVMTRTENQRVEAAAQPLTAKRTTGRKFR